MLSPRHPRFREKEEGYLRKKSEVIAGTKPLRTFKEEPTGPPRADGSESDASEKDQESVLEGVGLLLVLGLGCGLRPRAFRAFI